MRRLPNLNQIKAFEAAARHLSFKAAAEELFVSDAAVGHQIKALEEALGEKLFFRLTRKVKLTPVGEAYLPKLSAALDQIEAATQDILAEKETHVLKITAAPFYTNRLVLPRLPEFRALHPGLDVKIVFEDEVVDFATSDIVAGLRYGSGDWPDLHVDMLHGDVVSPVCAPSYISGRSLPLEPDEIAQMMLGVGGKWGQDWTDWFEAAGAPQTNPLNVIEYQNRARMFDLALSGNGVVLGDLSLIASDLEKGNLVRLHPLAIPRERGMFLVSPKGKPDPKLVKFRDWLLSIVREG